MYYCLFLLCPCKEHILITVLHIRRPSPQEDLGRPHRQWAAELMCKIRALGPQFMPSSFLLAASHMSSVPCIIVWLSVLTSVLTCRHEACFIHRRNAFCGTLHLSTDQRFCPSEPPAAILITAYPLPLLSAGQCPLSMKCSYIFFLSVSQWGLS